MNDDQHFVIYLLAICMYVEKLEHLSTGYENIKSYRHYGEQYEVSSKKFLIKLTYDPVIPLHGIYPK